MSRKAKSASKQRRKQQKQALKAQRKAQYAAFGAEGRTKGSRRFLKKGSGMVKASKHSTSKCGNVGCRRCNPRQNPAPRLSPVPGPKFEFRGTWGVPDPVTLKGGKLVQVTA